MLPVPDAGAMLPVLDLSGEKDIDIRVQSLIEEEATHPFDNGASPCL